MPMPNGCTRTSFPFSNTYSAARALAAVLAGGCAPFPVVSIVVAVAGASACAFSADAACVAFVVGMAALASASGLSFRSSTNTLATHVVARRGFRRVRASGFTGTPEDGRAWPWSRRRHRRRSGYTPMFSILMDSALGQLQCQVQGTCLEPIHVGLSLSLTKWHVNGMLRVVVTHIIEPVPAGHAILQRDINAQRRGFPPPPFSLFHMMISENVSRSWTSTSWLQLRMIGTWAAEMAVGRR